MTFVNRFLIGIIIFITIIWISGCGRDSDAVVVDFTETIAAARPSLMVSESLQLNVAVGAMISPKETFGYYRQLLNYIGEKLNREVQFVQRKTYSEINELLGSSQIDLAFICSGPYVMGKDQHGFELLVTPEVQGKHFYQSYLIVNIASQIHQIEDLRGQVFAFTDPDSNTGKLVPTYWLSQMGEQPETFFGKTIYTYSHDNSILAVARGLVEGAAVDSLIWEYYHFKNSIFTSRTRVIKKSEPYGMPPIVASSKLSSALKKRIRQVLVLMHQDDAGKKILAELMIDRFVRPEDEWYNSIREMDRKMMRFAQKQNNETEKP
jgi:phosphonate transport system substrate-binding protein